MLIRNTAKWYSVVLLILGVFNTATAQQFNFEDHLTSYPGLAPNCTPGKVLATQDGNWLAVAQCGQRQIAIVKYNAELQAIAEFGSDGVVTLDSGAGITSTPDFDSPQMPPLSEFIKVTDARLSPSGDLWVAGFNFDVQTFPDTPTAWQNFQPWWLKLDSNGVPILHDSGDVLHMQPNTLQGFANYGGGNWFGGLRSHNFVLPLSEGAAITGSVVLNYDANPLRQEIHIEKRTASNEPDDDFGENGVLKFEPFNSQQISNAAYIVGIYAFDEDHFLLASSDLYSYQYGGFKLRKISYQGSVDNSFGEGGVLSPANLISVDALNNKEVPGIQVANLSDIVFYEDWIYLVWQQEPNGAPFSKQNVVARYGLNGQLDTGFAQDGLYTWNAGFYEQADVLNGNPSLEVLDGQLALLSSDVAIPDGTVVYRSTKLQLLTHDGQLNTAFGNQGIITGQWAILDPFQFSGNQSYSPPLNANKSLHVLPHTRQLAVPYKSTIESEPNMAVLDVFMNRKPAQSNDEVAYTETAQGWIIDTNIIDPDSDDITATVISAPDFVSVNDSSTGESIQLSAATLEQTSQSFNVSLSVSDGINSAVQLTLDITLPDRTPVVADDPVNDDPDEQVNTNSGGSVSYIMLILVLLIGRRWR